jgi:hypothetical protein
MSAVTRKPLPRRNFGLGFIAIERDRLFLTTFWFAKLRQCSRDLVAGLRNIRSKPIASAARHIWETEYINNRGAKLDFLEA